MSALNQNQLDKLLPVLKLVIQTIKKKGQVSPKEINIFLRSIDLDDEEWASKELKKWTDLFIDYINPDNIEEREAIEITLEARGIPKANLTLALSELDKKETVSSEHLKSLSISLNVLNFGQLEPDKQKKLSFFVEGGPGEIENSIQYLQLSRSTFGVEREEIKAVIFGGAEGEQIADSIYFRTNNEVKEVTIIADWKEKKEIKVLTFLPQQTEQIIKIPVEATNNSGKILERPSNTSTFHQNVPENFVLVQNGTFMMGDNSVDSFPGEKPVHKVIFTYDFFIGKYPVSQKEYLALMGTNPSNFNGYNLPVEQVSWFDAINFCNTKSNNEGIPIAYKITTGELLNKNNIVTTDLTKVVGYRLPTEAEWEFAARGGNKSCGYKYSGSNSVDEVAWYSENSSEEKSRLVTKGIFFKKIENEIYFQKNTHHVGRKKPNELEIYDMSGNVWEWCTDYFGSYSNKEELNPYISNRTYTSNLRVVRGGSWIMDEKYIRISNRGSYIPENKIYYTGFRIVRTVV